MQNAETNDYANAEVKCVEILEKISGKIVLFPDIVQMISQSADSKEEAVIMTFGISQYLTDIDLPKTEIN